MIKKLLFPILLFITAISLEAQTWSAVGNGLSSNVILVNYLYADSSKGVIICSSVKHSPDTISVWNGAKYIYPYEPRLTGLCWDIDSNMHDSAWYCVTLYDSTTDFGTVDGDLYNYGYSGWSNHIEIPELMCPPIIANAANGTNLWFITGNELEMVWKTAQAPILSHACCLLEYNDVLYVGGNIGGYPLVTFSSLATNTTPPAFAYSNSITKTGGYVHAIAFYNNQLFAGGDFAGHLASWDAVHFKWDTIPGIPGTIYALQTYNGKLYIGGKFPNIYQYNDTTINIVGYIPNGDSVKTMAVFKDTLYVGGYFSNIDSISNTTNFAMYITPYEAPLLCSALSATITSIQSLDCKGDSVMAFVSAGAGKPPYTYQWMPSGGTKDTSSNLSTGIYTVSVTDANGCKTYASVQTSQATPYMTINVCNVKEPSCNGAADGCVSACITGGNAPYTYSWSLVPVNTNSTVCHLSAGTYTLTVNDNQGCTLTTIVTLNNLPPLLVTTDSLIVGGCNNSAWTHISGGTPKYTYSWSPGGQTTDTAKSLCPGTYTVTVTDSNGCTNTAKVTIPIITGLAQYGNSSDISVFPNPTHNFINVSIPESSSPIKATVIYDLTGRIMDKQMVSEYLQSRFVSINATNFAQGIYLIKLTTNDGERIARFSVIK